MGWSGVAGERVHQSSRVTVRVRAQVRVMVTFMDRGEVTWSRSSGRSPGRHPPSRPDAARHTSSYNCQEGGWREGALGQPPGSWQERWGTRGKVWRGKRLGARYGGDTEW